MTHTFSIVTCYKTHLQNLLTLSVSLPPPGSSLYPKISFFAVQKLLVQHSPVCLLVRSSWEVVLRGCPGRSSWEDVLGGRPGRSTWEVILRGCPGRSSWKVIPGFLSINFLFWADVYTWNERVSSFIVLCRDIQCLPNPFLRSFLMVSSWNIMDSLESSHSFASNCKVSLRGAITQVFFSWAYWAETL